MKNGGIRWMTAGHWHRVHAVKGGDYMPAICGTPPPYTGWEFEAPKKTRCKRCDRHLDGDSRWISVDDMLPDIGVKVLCCERDGDVHVSCYTGMNRDMPVENGDDLRIPVFADPTDYYHPFGMAGVEYWMPLPDVPGKRIGNEKDRK